MTDKIQGKKVGTARVRKGESRNDSNANYLHLIALVDSKYASLMLTN